jgi:hypothetical protein
VDHAGVSGDDEQLGDGELRPSWPGIALALLPGALTVYYSFESGGYYAAQPAVTAILLLLVLAGRILIMARPARGFNRLLGVAVAAFAAFALWTLLSGTWSDAPSRALTDFDRTLLYLLAFVLFGCAGGEAWRLRWLLRGFAIAAVAICAVALITRLLPNVWPTNYESVSYRLSYPLTYWNALGLLGALGVVFSLGFTCNECESPLARVLSAAAIPLLSCAVLLTLSRGAILTAAAGILLYAIVAHPRALVTGLVAVVPTSAIACLTAAHAKLVVFDMLTTRDVRPGTTVSAAMARAGQAQGHHVALVLALCVLASGGLRALLLRADEAAVRLDLSQRARRLTIAAAVAVLLAGLVGAAASVNLPQRFDHLSDSQATQASTAAGELTSTNTDARGEQWHVALAQFKATPIRGRGVGTFELSWNLRRPDSSVLLNAPIYAEVLAELGIIGFALLAIALLTILAGVARRARGHNQLTYAPALAGVVTWLLAVAIDYHYEIPAVTFWVFALAGTALAIPGDDAPRERYLAWLPRAAAAAAGAVLLVVVPLRLFHSQTALEAAFKAYPTGQCAHVTADAAKSARALSARPQPYVLIAACSLDEGLPAQALEFMREAVRREPTNGILQYGLAVALARDGLDPTSALEAGLRVDPKEPALVLSAPALERAHDAQGWRQASRLLQITIPAPT